MNPSPSAIAAIAAKVATIPGGWNNTDAQLYALLRALTVPNPVTVAPVVPKPFQTIDFVQVISAANLKQIVSLPSFDRTIRPLLDSPDPKIADTIRQLNQWSEGAAKIGDLTTGAGSEYDLLAAPGPQTAADSIASGTTVGAPPGLFNATYADPTWTPNIPWDVATLGRTIGPRDVAAARASAGGGA